MPMIDVYAAAGTFVDKNKLAQDLANAVMKWEGVPSTNLFRKNTAAFVHELPSEAISNATGDRTLANRTWVLITESPDGGWGINGQAFTNADIVASARQWPATPLAGSSLATQKQSATRNQST